MNTLEIKIQVKFYFHLYSSVLNDKDGGLTVGKGWWNLSKSMKWAGLV